MNSISISGNLVRQAETRSTGAGETVVSFTVADNVRKDKPPLFWQCSFFGKRGVSVAPYLLKGQPVTVSGSLSEREWTDKDGTPRKTMQVSVHDICLQGGPRAPDAEADGQRHHQHREPVQQPVVRKAAPSPEGSGFDDMDDDIPF